MNKVRIGIVLYLVAVLSGCGGQGNKKRVSVLEESIENYTQALRWNMMDDAASYHVNRDGEKAMIDLEPVKSIRVTSYHITGKTINDDFTEASVNGELNYYSTDYGTLSELPLNQKWWYQESSGKWFLESDFPEFK